MSSTAPKSEALDRLALSVATGPRRRRIVLWIAAAAAAACGVFLLLPSPIDPAAYAPPPAPPLTGVYQPNLELRQADLLGVGLVHGPEDVAIDVQGRVYAGTSDGLVVRILDDGAVEVFATTDGRPLGMDFDPQGNLIVADARLGLLSIDQQGSVRVLATEAENTPLGFTDDVDVARDGTIYFSDASSKWGVDQYLFDLLEARPHGRLLAYDPASGQVRVLLKDLYFANGVALSQAEDFVLVNETYRYRITRYWLTGPQAGTSDVFIDNLPGFPDGVSADGAGTFWVALFTVRNELLDWLSPRPFFKAQLAKLPRSFWPQPKPYGFVLGLDEHAAVTHNLQDKSGGHLWEITSVERHNDSLYLGSLHNARIGRYRLP